MNFVAGGIQQTGSKDKQKKENDEEDIEQYLPKPMFGTQIDSRLDITFFLTFN